MSDFGDLYFDLDYHNYGMIRELEKRGKRRSRINVRARGNNRKRIEELEDQVHFHLMNRTVINLLLERGICQRDELMALFLRLDQADGVPDGGSTTDDLAQDIGFEESPTERPKPAPKSLRSTRRRRRD